MKIAAVPGSASGGAELESDHYFAVRLALDVLAAELAAHRAGSNDLLDLRAVHAQLVDAVLADDRLAMVGWNFRFHEGLYRVSFSRPLSWVADRVLRDLVRFTLMPASGRLIQEVVLSQHWGILRALEAGNVDHARRAAAIHVQTMRDCWRLALGYKQDTSCREG